MNGGISKNVLTQGWHVISPTVKTSLYSVGIEQSYLTSEDKGDSPKDESFKTPTADGKSLQVDLEFSYKFDQSRVTDVFTINEQISNFAQTYPTNLKASSNEALLFMRRYRFANCSCFSCCFKDAYPSSNVQ